MIYVTYTYVVLERGDFYLLQIEQKQNTSDVEIALANRGLRSGSTDDIFSFRVNQDWNEFRPLVALGSTICHGDQKFVARVPPRGGDLFQIHLAPREGQIVSIRGVESGLWETNTWFIAKKIKPNP